MFDGVDSGNTRYEDFRRRKRRRKRGSSESDDYIAHLLGRYNQGYRELGITRGVFPKTAIANEREISKREDLPKREQLNRNDVADLLSSSAFNRYLPKSLSSHQVRNSA